MADPTDSGLSSPDPEHEQHHHPRPHLCSACSQIDFKALFTSHERRIYEKYREKICKCAEILEAREKHGWPGPESANDSKPPCCFCKFYNECLLRSKDIASRSKNDSRWEFRNGPSLKGFHSLIGFPIKHRGCKEGTCSRHYVQDVYALQFVGQFIDPGLDFRPLHGEHHQSMEHAILRVVDGPEFPGLTRERAAGGGLLARRIIPHQVNYNIIGEWLSLCRSWHVHCNCDADVVTIPGFQVIDCTTIKILSAVDLLVSGGEPGRVEYVTLSYVWGQAAFNGPVLREDALCLPEDLPLVISDAIDVVKRLGYRYLWIDRYCIPQNDLPAKQIQIKNMERIYSCSVLTIIAAAGDGPEYGLPGVSSRHRREQLSVQVAEEISLLFYEKPSVFFASSKWNTRGWTYQEGLLSKRRLVFTDELAYFQCYEMHGDEVLSLPIPGVFGQFDEFRYISFEHDHPEGIIDQTNFGALFPRRITDWSNPDTAWNRIEQFARRQLAFDEDTLDAIAGIFGRYLSFNPSKTKEDGISFFCGLPVIPFPPGDPYNHFSTPTTSSMQKLWVQFAGQSLSQCIPDGAESAAHDIYTNLTYRLVNSLLWFDKWEWLEIESIAIPTDRERHLRRSGFPSWTWAGWKICKIKFRQLDAMGRVFDSCTTVHVEYEDEAGLLQRLDWEKDNESIQNLSHQESKFPLYLLIKGTVMDMKLAWHKSTDESEDTFSKLGGYWIFTSPPFLEGTGFVAPRCLFEDIELKDGNDRASTYLTRNEEVNVLGMTLAATRTRKLDDMWVMILRPVTRLLKGQPETMYERAHLHTFAPIDFDSEFIQSGPPIAGGFFRETTVRLCWE